jgi:FlaA1/EpsC-like NDP-sugar epimerase
MNNSESHEIRSLHFSFSKKRIVKTLIDGVLIALAYALAYLIRFDFNLPEMHLQMMEKTILIAVLLNIVFINFLRINQSRWRYSSIQDLLNIFAVLTIGWITFIIYLYFTNSIGLPRSVLTVYWLLTLLFLGGIRFLPRMALKIRGSFTSGLKRVLVIGAGDAGEMIIRQTIKDPKLGYIPVAILDDNTRKLKTKIHGIPVVGTLQDVNQIVNKYRIDEIIIATPSAKASEMRNIVLACESTGIEFKTVPGPKEIVDGKVEVAQLRKVKIEDLLDRNPINIDLDQIKQYLDKKVVLVTGAGGSIGSELSRQILELKPKKLICLDRSENGLFYLGHDLNQINNDTCYETIVADILDKDKISRIFDTSNIDIVFHAAAYKHVPLMELHPDEAVMNNIVGTLNMVQLAELYHVEKFVLISTDKAVNPTSVMGATKRVAELILQSYSAISKTALVTVRFGNVLGSFGSVVPLFQKQIAKGGPVTITNENMSRFFMTIPEAVKLILQAAKMSAGNDIFVLDMGEPIKLINIAKRLIKLSGLEPYKDIKIKFIGMRPGEKIHEELWNRDEVPLKTDHPKISSAIGSHYNHWDLMSKKIAALVEMAQTGNIEGIIEKLRAIIPEYTADERIHSKMKADSKKIILVEQKLHT